MIIIAYQYYLSLLHYGKTVRIIHIVCSCLLLFFQWCRAAATAATTSCTISGCPSCSSYCSANSGEGNETLSLLSLFERF